MLHWQVPWGHRDLDSNPGSLALRSCVVLGKSVHSLSLRDSRESLQCPASMPAFHELMIYVKGWALCLANGRYSGSYCNYYDAHKSESSGSGSESSRRHRAKEAG